MVEVNEMYSYLITFLLEPSENVSVVCDSLAAEPPLKVYSDINKRFVQNYALLPILMNLHLSGQELGFTLSGQPHATKTAYANRRENVSSTAQSSV